MFEIMRAPRIGTKIAAKTYLPTAPTVAEIRGLTDIRRTDSNKCMVCFARGSGHCGYTRRAPRLACCANRAALAFSSRDRETTSLLGLGPRLRLGAFPARRDGPGSRAPPSFRILRP